MGKKWRLLINNVFFRLFLMEFWLKIITFAPQIRILINIYIIFKKKSLVNESDLHFW